MQPTESPGNGPTYPDLAGKVAVVTGGSGGIGSATCRALAASGALVVVNGRDEGKIDAVVSAIRSAGGQAIGIAGDFTDAAEVERLRDRAEEELGPVDILCPFVGTGRARPGPIAGIPIEDWQSTVDGSLTATFLAIRAFLPGMTERGRGAIVTMASSAARMITPASAAYAAAKAGVIALTRYAAAEAGPSGVRINCLAPYTVLTEAIERVMPPERRDQLTATIPLRRLATPDDIANAAAYLASDASGWVTGVVLDVAGGAVMA